MAKNNQKLVITGQMLAMAVSITGVIASILLLVFDNDKTASALFLVFSLLWFAFNLLNNRKKVLSKRL